MRLSRLLSRDLFWQHETIIFFAHTSYKCSLAK